MSVARVLVAVFLSLPAIAIAAPDVSLRPVARDAAPAPALTRPMARPAILEAALADQLEHEMRGVADPAHREELVQLQGPLVRSFVPVTAQATGMSLRPFVRPDGVAKKAMAQQQARIRGAVCGDPALQGEVVGHVPGQSAGCGIANGVRVRSVSGIPLSQGAVLDCPTAKALRAWVDKGMKPATDSYRGGVKQIRVAAHYACRTRNNQAGQQISEHGKGRAIDISGFYMRDGSQITLVDGWDHRTTGRVLRDMHRRACGIFGTVLGPESNRFHRDHFHFDTARYRSGSYCR